MILLQDGALGGRRQSAIRGKAAGIAGLYDPGCQ
jgi:hypothetical protein